MSKWRRFKPLAAKQASHQGTSKKSLFESKSKPVALVGVIAASIVGLGIAAYAANDLLHGRVSVTEQRNQMTTIDAATKDLDTNTASKSARNGSKATSDLEDKYGIAAASPAVSAAIQKAGGVGGVKNIASIKAASEASEALQHGVWKPGANPMMAIMYGYVPPGMAPEHAAMLYRTLPHLPKSPRTGPMTEEMADQLAGGPADPASGLPEGLNQHDVRAANEKMIRGYMRERLGPVYIPPFHRDHNCAAKNSVAAIDHQGSIREMLDTSGNIVAEYTYDPYGRQTKLAGSSPDADFGYGGYYVHQRSGLNLTATRAYSPVLGRFLNRDPIEEVGGINLYAYVENRPINRTDPSGTSFMDGGGGGSMTCPASPPPANPIGAKCREQCKSKLPILGPLLVAGGAPVVSTGPKIGGGSTGGTSILSSALRGSAIDVGIPSTWAPTWGDWSARTGSLGGCLGRWAPILGAGLTAKEYADFLDCIQKCINCESKGK